VAPETDFARSKTLIFDTGPLWELILYRAMEEGFHKGLKRHFLKDKPDYEKFTRFLGGFPWKTTTAHVVAEISSHIKRGIDHRKRDFWKIPFEQFEGMRMGEHLIKLLDMRERILETDHDAVDASVLQLGLNLRADNPTIFTTEDSLAGRCRNAQIKVAHIHEVIWN
jgi:hypothetical protein